MLKEIEIIQRALDKFDSWVVQIRVGVVVGLYGVIWLRSNGENLEPLKLAFVIIAVAWLGEAVLRFQYQDGYLRKQQIIEEFLNRDCPSLRLFDPKDEANRGWPRGFCRNALKHQWFFSYASWRSRLPPYF